MATSPLANLPFEAWRLRWAASPLPAALARLRETLLGLLPAGLRALWFPPVRRLWLRVEGEALQVIEEAGEVRSAVGTLPLAGGDAAQALAASLERRGVEGELWVLLPPDRALVRTLTLPLAAETQLLGLLRHEIDRQTPFTPDQVEYSAQVLSRRPAEGQLQAELVVVPKTTLEAVFAALGPLAARLSGADIDDHLHRSGRHRNVLPLARRVHRADRDGRVRWALCVAGLAALLLTGMLTLQNREAALATLEAQRETAYGQAREARALRQQLEGAASAANFLAEQRQKRPTMLELLDDLTRRLPDDVYIQRFAVEQDRVTLSGAARSAGTIVATLQASPYLKGPALAGAVQQDRNTGRDGFTVVAELVPGGRDAAKP